MKQSLRAATALAVFARRSASRPAPSPYGVFERMYRFGFASLRLPRGRHARAKASLDTSHGAEHE